MSKLYEELRDQLNQEKGVAMATVVRGIEHVGAKILVFPGKRTDGTLGNAALDARVIEDADHAIWHGEADTHTYTIEGSTGTETYDVFIEGFPPPPTLIIVGAGHIAIPLTTFAKTLNYRVEVVDARAAFATRERFPHGPLPRPSITVSRLSMRAQPLPHVSVSRMLTNLSLSGRMRYWREWI